MPDASPAVRHATEHLCLQLTAARLKELQYRDRRAIKSAVETVANIAKVTLKYNSYYILINTETHILSLSVSIDFILTISYEYLVRYFLKLAFGCVNLKSSKQFFSLH